MKESLAEGSLAEGSLTAPAIIIIIFYFIPVGIIDEGENLQKVVQHLEPFFGHDIYAALLLLGGAAMAFPL